MSLANDEMKKAFHIWTSHLQMIEWFLEYFRRSKGISNQLMSNDEQIYEQLMIYEQISRARYHHSTICKFDSGTLKDTSY